MALSPITQLAVAALNGGLIILAARLGHLADIAAFALGTGAMGIVSVIVGGGTALIYTTGDAIDRSAVRRVRWRMLAPLQLLTATIITGSVWITGSGLPTLSIWLGCVVVVLTGLQSMDASDLQREGHLAAWSVTSVSARLAGLVVLVAGASYSTSMATSAAALIAGMSFLNLTRGRRITERRTVGTTPLRDDLRFALRLDFGAIALLDVVIIRLPFLVAPIVTSPALAGQFATILTSVMSASTVLTSALYSVMTARASVPVARRRDYLDAFERMVTLSVWPVALLSAFMAPAALVVLDFERDSGAWTFWVAASLMLIPLVYNRRYQYRALSLGQRRAALSLSATTCGASVVGALVSLALGRIDVVAWTPLWAEACGFVVFGSRQFRAAERSDTP